jgi:hypothetical protein
VVRRIPSGTNLHRDIVATLGQSGRPSRSAFNPSRQMGALRSDTSGFGGNLTPRRCAQQLRQLGDVSGDPPGLVAGEELGLGPARRDAGHPQTAAKDASIRRLVSNASAPKRARQPAGLPSRSTNRQADETIRRFLRARRASPVFSCRLLARSILASTLPSATPNYERKGLARRPR